LGIDADPAAIDAARERLKPYSGRAVLVKENFRNLRDICIRHDFLPVDGVIFDLGMSSLQLEDRGRGFSFKVDGPLDMRFDPEQLTTAATIVNEFPEDELAAVLRAYGEERRSHLIARRVVASRPIDGTQRLAEIVRQVVGRGGRIHPATRTFQAIRIAVNQELVNLEEVLQQTVGVLKSGGRLAVLSYHSLEDRLVKSFIYRESKDCLCSAEVPVCTCGHRASLRVINRKAVRPSPAEREANPRSRSARLRMAERL